MGIDAQHRQVVSAQRLHSAAIAYLWGSGVGVTDASRAITQTVIGVGERSGSLHVRLSF